MTQQKDQIGMYRIIDSSGNTVAEFNRGDNRKWYMWSDDYSLPTEVELSGTMNGYRTLQIAGTVSTENPILDFFTGTAVAGGAATIQFPEGATESSAVDDYHVGHLVGLVSGTGSGLGADSWRRISVYDADGAPTRLATVTPAWTTQPDNTSIYEVGRYNIHTELLDARKASHYGKVVSALGGQDILGGDVNFYPKRIRIFPFICEDECSRWHAITLKIKAITVTASFPGYMEWKWLWFFKGVTSTAITVPALWDGYPTVSQVGLEMTATISDVVISTNTNVQWIDFTLQMTSNAAGIAVWSETELMGIS